MLMISMTNIVICGRVLLVTVMTMVLLVVLVVVVVVVVMVVEPTYQQFAAAQLPRDSDSHKHRHKQPIKYGHGDEQTDRQTDRQRNAAVKIIRVKWFFVGQLSQDVVTSQGHVTLTSLRR